LQKRQICLHRKMVVVVAAAVMAVAVTSPSWQLN
jgi:hypothetical protein